MIKGKPAGKHTCHCEGKSKPPKGSGKRMAVIIGVATPKRSGK